MGIICFSPLAQGLLSEKYLKDIPKDSRMARDGRFLHASDLTEAKKAAIRSLDAWAKERGQTLPQMALAFVLHSKEVTSVLIGASKAEQILENLDSLKQPDFSEEELRRIDKISLPVARM